MDHIDTDQLRRHAQPRSTDAGDGRVREPVDPADEPSGRNGTGLFGRVVMSAAYLVQWARSRVSKRHEGRS